MSEETAEQDIRSLKLCESLLCWINSFKHIISNAPLSIITDLTDSTLLIDCILAATPDKSALPDFLQNDLAVKSLQFETSNIYLNHESNFSKILATFACFFDKPMEQAISLPGLLSGCEQEFVKLLLIFLTYAMKQKPNELQGQVFTPVLVTPQRVYLLLERCIFFSQQLFLLMQCFAFIFQVPKVHTHGTQFPKFYLICLRP